MPETLAFELYGTLVDPLRIAQHLERLLGSAAQRTAGLWRMKQLEYTFRLTATLDVADGQPVGKLRWKCGPVHFTPEGVVA